MPERVRDRRSLYFRLGPEQVQDTEEVPFEARTFSGAYSAADPLVIAASVCGGLLVEAGATEVRVRLYDGQTPGDVIAANQKAAVRTSVFDGFIAPIRLNKGILITVDQTDAQVTVLWKG